MQDTRRLEEIVHQELMRSYSKYSPTDSFNITTDGFSVSTAFHNGTHTIAQNRQESLGRVGGGMGSGKGQSVGKRRRKGLGIGKTSQFLTRNTTSSTWTTSNVGGGRVRKDTTQNATILPSSSPTARNYAPQFTGRKGSVLPGPLQTTPLARSTRTTTGEGSELKGGGRSSSRSSTFLMMSAPGGLPAFGTVSNTTADILDDGGMSSNIITNAGVPGSSSDVVVGARRILDIHQISTRLHRSFEWEGQNHPHSLALSSVYIVPLILLLGLVVACGWLFCACIYYNMIKLSSWCAGRRKSRKMKKGNFNEEKKEVPTPEILEARRQERLAFLQEECANLEQQLTGLRAQQQNEKSATLTSRASDSDLEYLGASESPPLKRNSISLQDIPQSVVRIRREKELRQIKEEIEFLRNFVAQQEKENADAAVLAHKGGLLTQEFELPGSKPSSPSETKVEPLSQHISHLKTQRKLNEIRTELEDLAMQLLHADEIKAKRSSLQDLPRTALNIKREQSIITMTNELSKMKNYKLQKRNVIETALEKSNNSQKGSPSGKKAEGGNSNSGGGVDKSGSKSFNSIKENPSKEDSATKYSDPEFVHKASIRRQREQELNRVRVELKDLAYKLNLNPMNYISEDRMRLVPSQSMQSTASAQSNNSPLKKLASIGSKPSSASLPNHV